MSSVATKPSSSSRPSATVEEKQDAAAAGSSGSKAAPGDEPPSCFLDILVTPKLTFALAKKPQWRRAEDIPQEELREAFLARWPVRFDADKLAFTCATPSLELSNDGAQSRRLVFRITSVNGGDDERVLLQILSSLDKAYAAKYEKLWHGKLEEAKADLLSSSMSFQVIADEVRLGQQAAEKKFRDEVRSLKEHLSTNQKRLFLLEREKEGLQRTCQTSEEASTKLRHVVDGLSAENAQLKTRQSELEAQIASLRERRLLHWNILDGGGNRLDGIIRYIHDGNYDIVTLNELNGFDKSKLAHLGKRCGMAHSLLLAKSRYHLGVLSRHPIHALKHERGHDFVHGLLCASVLGVTLCVTHLNPHDVHKRAEEARAIVERHARREIDSGRPFVLVGDLNTLSGLDGAAHAQAHLPSKIRNGPYSKPLAKKFLDKGRKEIDYTPMQVLLDAPLRDVGEGGGHSVPTKINADHMHFASLRLDYCLVSEAVVARGVACGVGGDGRTSHVRARLVRDERTDTLSDHFPLEVNFW